MSALAEVRDDLRLRERVAVAHEVLDPSFGAALARRWLADHWPGARLQRARAHSALYRGGDDLSVRVGVEVRRPGAGADLTLLVRIRSGAITTTAFPDDPSLPTLPALLDPAAAAEVIRAAVPTVDLRPPTVVEPLVVHHPRTGACVLRYVLRDAPAPVSAPASAPVSGDLELYAKVYPSAVETRAAATALGGVGASRLHGEHGSSVRLPRLLGLDEEHRVVFLESLGSDHPGGEVRPEGAAQVLRSLHAALPARAPAYVPPPIEVDRVHAELVLARTIWPELARTVADGVSRAAMVLAGSGEGPVVLSHGDFTPSQLLRLDDGSIGLVDLDTLRMAEAASDLGHFLAYAELDLARRGVQAGGADGAVLASGSRAERWALQERFLTAYASAVPGEAVDPQRVRAYRALSLAMTALRSARRFKEERVRLALALLDDTHDADGGAR